MENVYKQQPGLFRLRAIAIWEWLMILPATLLLAAAALRVLQPRQYEPARTSWMIFEWAMTHISRLGAAILFIGLPGVVVAAGCAALLQNWRKDQALRHEMTTLFTILRLRLAFCLLAAAVLLAGAILASLAVHVVTD